MDNGVSPLSRLVVDEAGVDLELLASTLEGLVRLDVKRGAFAFLQGVRASLSSKQQVVAALLSQKALHLLDAQFAEALKPQEVERLTGVKGGTLRPILKTLNDDRVVRQDSGKAYYVPGFAVEEAGRILSVGRGRASAAG